MDGCDFTSKLKASKFFSFEFLIIYSERFEQYIKIIDREQFPSLRVYGFSLLSVLRKVIENFENSSGNVLSFNRSIFVTRSEILLFVD